MKKVLYYFSPFVVIAILFGLLDLLDYLGMLQPSPIILVSSLFIISVIIGNLTSTKRKFDLLITIIVPFALFSFLFIVGFLEAGETYSRFDFDHAFKVALVNYPWYIYLSLAISTFIASFKPLRIFKKKN